MDMHPIAEMTAEKSTNVRSKNKAMPPALIALRAGLSVLGAVAPESAAAIAEHLFVTPKRRPRPAAEHELLARARHVLVPSEDGALASWEWGTEGARVLLVHGWEGRGAQLGAMVEPLLERGFRVVTFDAPAHGSSPGSVSSLVHFARATETVARAYGPIEAIVTHSMGGASTAWAFRNGAFARRLVMIAPPIDVRDFTRQLTTALSLSEDVRAHVERRLARRFGVAPEELQVARVAPRMTTPLLVIHDEHDREVPIACGELVARSWPGAALLRTQGLGHQRVLRDPQVLAEVARFLVQGRAA